MANFDGTDDTFDSREVIKRTEEIETDSLAETGAEEFDSELLDPETREEYDALLVLREDAADGTIADFEYGETFVSDDYFEEYAQQLADDIAAPGYRSAWPATYIDWEAAADALKQDYTPFEFRGTTYWAR